MARAQLAFGLLFAHGLGRLLVLLFVAIVARSQLAVGFRLHVFAVGFGVLALRVGLGLFFFVPRLLGRLALGFRLLLFAFGFRFIVIPRLVAFTLGFGLRLLARQFVVFGIVRLFIFGFLRFVLLVGLVLFGRFLVLELVGQLVFGRKRQLLEYRLRRRPRSPGELNAPLLTLP